MTRRGRDKRNRLAKPVIWLITEGETEYNYFSALRNDRRQVEGQLPVAIKVRCAGGKSAKHVVDTAQQYRQALHGQLEGQRFFCVLDTEDDTSDKRKSLEAALRQADKKGFDVVLSNPCFEVWLHCHFDDFMPRQFITCDECVAELQKAWIRHGVSADPYKKGDPKIYRKLSGRLLAAIAAAKHLRQVHHKTVKRTADANASTDVYALVEYLQGVVPE